MITMRLDKTEYARVMRALNEVRRRIKFFITDNGGDLNRRSSIGYKQLLVKNIMNTTRPVPAYSVRYRSWKLKHGKFPYPAPWRLFGDLVKSISNFKSGTGWMGGVPAGVFDSGGKSMFGGKGKPKLIAMYAAVNERKRPIFRPTMDEYAGSEWPRLAGSAMRDIEGGWK